MPPKKPKEYEKLKPSERITAPVAKSLNKAMKASHKATEKRALDYYKDLPLHEATAHKRKKFASEYQKLASLNLTSSLMAGGANRGYDSGFRDEFKVQQSQKMLEDQTKKVEKAKAKLNRPEVPYQIKKTQDLIKSAQKHPSASGMRALKVNREIKKAKNVIKSTKQVQQLKNKLKDDMEKVGGVPANQRTIKYARVSPDLPVKKLKVAQREITHQLLKSGRKTKLERKLKHDPERVNILKEKTDKLPNVERVASG